MIETNFEKCTACGACIQVCPKTCISWQEGEFGFLYPHVNKAECIDCHLCERVCPIDKMALTPDRQHFYAAVNQDQNILLKSTSGGAFSALAGYVLAKGGVVYGCAMNDEFQVEHIRISDEQDLEQLRSSKYVQSNILNTFRQALTDLRDNRYVLFSGTPCQIAGLNLFLEKNYDKLITVDIVCHGVGSQKYFDKFVTNLEEREGRVAAIRFRDKKYVGWSCGGGVVVTSNYTSKSGNIEKPFYDFENYYYAYFLAGKIYRKSCYSCSYASLNRPGDFTLGDFWGVESLNLDLDVTHGCSLIITNNEKAHKILDQLDILKKVEVSYEQAAKQNAQLNHPVPLDDAARKKLLKQYETMSSKEIQERYCSENKKNLIKGNIKVHMPYGLRVLIRKLR